MTFAILQVNLALVPRRHSKPLDGLHLFRRGESFWFAVKILQAQHPNIWATASFATMTNLAFALEAYLKVLGQLLNDTPALDGHNLRDLFHDLPTHTQRDIRRKWLKEQGGPAKMKKDARATPMPLGMKVPQSFEEALDLSAEAFIHWRYNHTTPSHFHVGGLLPMVRDEILRAQPDWRPFVGHPLTILNPHPDFAKPKDEHVTTMIPAISWKVFNKQAAPLNLKGWYRPDPKDRGSD